MYQMKCLKLQSLNKIKRPPPINELTACTEINDCVMVLMLMRIGVSGVVISVLCQYAPVKVVYTAN